MTCATPSTSSSRPATSWRPSTWPRSTRPGRHRRGAKLTVIDIRANVSASKADNFFLIRPGTDYAFNLGVIHALIYDDLYNKDYVEQFVDGFDRLKEFVKPYSPEWAAAETGATAEGIRDLARQLSAAAPSVVWHPGWMVARYNDSFQVVARPT
jgi:Anaerobic dehydrogenases, typically selenocysteine-containing